MGFIGVFRRRRLRALLHIDMSETEMNFPQYIEERLLILT